MTGLIEPTADPELTAKDLAYYEHQLNDEQIQKLNHDSQTDIEGFEKCKHLPKCAFDPTKRDFDSNKETLVINYVEDDILDSGIHFLKALDKYFKLDVAEVNSIKNRFNIFITWSTSIEDMLKTLKAVQIKGADLSKASVLFLNDLNINVGTGPNFTLIGKDLNWLGKQITEIAKEVFNLDPNRIRTIYQTGAKKQWQPESEFNDTNQWSKMDDQKSRQAIEDFSRVLESRADICLGKVSNAVPKWNELNTANKAMDFKGIHIPLQSFLNSLAKTES